MKDKNNHPVIQPTILKKNRQRANSRTDQPVTWPSNQSTSQPSHQPSNQPTDQPTSQASNQLAIQPINYSASHPTF